MGGILVEIFSEIVCLYCAVKGACVSTLEYRTKTDIPRNTYDDNDKNINSENNNDRNNNNNNNNEGIQEQSVHESDDFLNAYYCHFVTIPSLPNKQLIQSFQNMKKSLLEIINYSSECNTSALSAVLPLPLYYHNLLAKKIQIALKDRNSK